VRFDSGDASVTSKSDQRWNSREANSALPF
jgi:hypothetical protein